MIERNQNIYREMNIIENTSKGITPKTYRMFNVTRSTDCNIIKLENKDINGSSNYSQKVLHKDGEQEFVNNKENFKLIGEEHCQINDKGTYIYITKDILDCLSISQISGNKYQVVSLVGHKEQNKELADNISFLNSYKQIIFVNFKKSDELIGLFDIEKIFTLNFKDLSLNKILQDKDITPSDKKSMLFHYKKFLPSGIVNAADLDYEDLVNTDDDGSYLTNFECINNKLYGIRKGELLTVVAGSGLGKSTLVREIGFYLYMNQGLKLGYIALEENNKRSGLGFMGIDVNCPISIKENLIEFKKNNSAELKESKKKVLDNGRLFLFNHFGSLGSEDLFNKLRFLAKGAEVDFIILDHISIIVSGMTDNDERRTIDNLMTKLRSFVEETGVGMILVSHLKRPSGNQGHEDGLQVSLSHLRGSGSIAQLSDGVIGIERNQQTEDEEEKNIATVRVLKNRYSGEVGYSGKIKFNPITGRMKDYINGEETEVNNKITTKDEPIKLNNLVKERMEKQEQHEKEQENKDKLIEEQSYDFGSVDEDEILTDELVY